MLDILLRSYENKRKRQSQKRLGFTFVELVVVIAIVGVLAAITIPTILSTRRGEIQKAEARAKAGFMEFQSAINESSRNSLINQSNVATDSLVILAEVDGGGNLLQLGFYPKVAGGASPVDEYGRPALVPHFFQKNNDGTNDNILKADTVDAAGKFNSWVNASGTLVRSDANGYSYVYKDGTKSYDITAFIKKLSNGSEFRADERGVFYVEVDSKLRVKSVFWFKDTLDFSTITTATVADALNAYASSSKVYIGSYPYKQSTPNGSKYY